MSVVLAQSVESHPLFDLCVYFVATFGKYDDKEVWRTTEFVNALHTNALEQDHEFCPDRYSIG
jgi:hypothetical protein